MEEHKYKQVGELFVIDENIVYRLTTLLTKKELDKMSPLSRYVYTADMKKLINKHSKKITFKNKAFFITPIKNSDPKTFKCFSLRWAADKNQVYHYTKPTKKIDVKSFEHLITFDPIFNDLAKDKNFVYNINVLRKIRNADPKTFEILNKFWAKDKNHVFCVAIQKWQRKIDIKTFKISSLKTSKAEDANYFYHIVESNDGFHNGKVKRKKKKNTASKNEAST